MVVEPRSLGIFFFIFMSSYLCLFQIDYVDGRARTQRITDSSSTKISTSHPVNSNNGGPGGFITEVTIQPHNGHKGLGTFVDSSDGGPGSPQPPPHPPKVPTIQVS